MVKTYIMWGLFIAISGYMIYELFFGQKHDIDIPEPEPETDEDRELAELAEQSVAPDDYDDSIELQEQAMMGKAPDPNRKLVRVFLADSPVQSRMIEMKLAESGIESVIEPIGASIFPLDPDSGSEESILVGETDYKQAQDIIRQFIEEEEAKKNRQTSTDSSQKEPRKQQPDSPEKKS